MKIQLRAVIEFAEHDDFRIVGGICFDRFLPFAENARPMIFRDTGLTATLVADPTKHLGSWERDAIETGNVAKRLGLSCSGLYVLLEAEVEAALADELNEGTMTPNTKQFGERVADTLNRIHVSLIDFARNERQLYWLNDPRRPALREERGVQERLMRYETRLRVPDGWRLLVVEPQKIEATLRLGQSAIDREAWDHFCNTLADRGYRARGHRRLLANAHSLFDKGDVRSAVVEAIAAWESVLVNDGPTILAKHRAQLGVKDWEDLIERAGLRASSRFFLAILSPVLPDLKSSAESLMEAIDVRNQIVHKGRRRFEYEEIRRLLQAVREVIVACELPHPAT
jgi:hypothetical protein